MVCVVVCDEVYERRNCEENSDSQGDIVVYEMHKVVFSCRFKYYNSTSTPIQIFTAVHTVTHYKVHTPTNALFIKLDKVLKFTLKLTLTFSYILPFC